MRYYDRDYIKRCFMCVGIMYSRYRGIETILFVLKDVEENIHVVLVITKTSGDILKNMCVITFLLLRAFV